MNDHIDGNIIVASAENFDQRFFIDLPIPQTKSLKENFSPRAKMARVEIPQSLANYIYGLQEQNQKLQKDIAELRKKLSYGGC